MKRFLCIVLSLTMILCLAGCSKDSEEVEETPAVTVDDQPPVTMKGVDSFYETLVTTTSWGSYVNFIENETADEAFRRYRDFSNRLLLASIEKGENDFVSPYSLFNALAILTNGAEGNTRAQLEWALGMSCEDLNEFLHDLEPARQEYDEVNYRKVNAIWFNTHEGLKLKEDFKNTINEYYGDCAAEDDFGNGSGLAEKVNRFASENTDGGIENIVSDSDFSSRTAFLILNALATGDRWSFPFESSNTRYQDFHNYDGSVSTVEMMHQTLWGHWSDANAQGFYKRLDNSVDFVAILPNEGIDVYDYLAQMNPDTLRPFLEYDTFYENIEEGGPYGCTADAHYTNIAMPMFKFDKEYDISSVMKKMGLADLFDPARCDFSAMADGDAGLVSELYVDKVKQNTSIEVNEERVVASAVTVVMGGLGAGGCEERQKIYHDVILDRPFIFALTMGGEKQIYPLFIGVVAKAGGSLEGAFRIENIIGKINVRSLPSTKGEKLGSFEKGEILYAFEKKEAEGYTWYRIGDNKWVADKNGEWIKVK